MSVWLVIYIWDDFLSYSSFVSFVLLPKVTNLVDCLISLQMEERDIITIILRLILIRFFIISQSSIRHTVIKR